MEKLMDRAEALAIGVRLQASMGEIYFSYGLSRFGTREHVFNYVYHHRQIFLCNIWLCFLQSLPMLLH